jgi:hypothetical protein
MRHLLRARRYFRAATQLIFIQSWCSRSVRRPARILWDLRRLADPVSRAAISRLLQPPLTAAFGAAVGVVGSLWFGNFASHSRQEPRPTRLDNANVQALASSANPSLEERTRRYALRLEQHDQRVSDHYREPVYQPWAEGMESKVRGALVSSKVGKAHLSAVSCRSETCVVTFEWDSYIDAISGPHLARIPISPDCTRELILPLEGQAGAPYVAKLLVACPPSGDGGLRLPPESR